MARTGGATTTSVDRNAPPAAADDRAAALAAAQRAAGLLVRRYGARRVYLFGSLAGTGSALFQPASDIDLAVEGLPGEGFWKALAAVDAVMPRGHPANIIRLESAQPFIREVVLQRGVLLASRAKEVAKLLDDEVTMERPRWHQLAEEIEHELAELGAFCAYLRRHPAGRGAGAADAD